MSEIQRFRFEKTITAGCLTEWVTYIDHRAEVERVTRQNSENFWEVECLKNAIALRTSERDEALAEVERLTAERDEARGEVERVTRQNSENFAEVECLKNAIDHLTDHLMSERDEAQDEVKRLTEQVGALTLALALEQADEMKAHAEAETDRVTAERDAAQAEVERLTKERDAAQAEVERLRANSAASLTSSRPTDEDIWREAFMQQLFDHDVEKLMDAADLAVALYRKRWPR